MGKPTGFLEFKRDLPKAKDSRERIKDYKEIYLDFGEQKTLNQAARCMDCGVPFCHSGCPLGNIIPDFNDAVYHEDWEKAYQILSSTNNFPEFTGRICPAPCEASCVLGINNPPVTIEYIEKAIVEKAFESGYVKPHIPAKRTGKKVAIVGSGPAGLAAASQMNKAGHWVTVFERDDRIGGLLRYGIPDFKLEKWVIDRRINLMMEAGIVFKTNSEVGKNVNANEMMVEYDAIILCGGSTVPRDLPIPGRELKGIHFAMEFLTQQNKRVAGDKFMRKDEIFATNKNVIVIGGGDTGSDCVGTSNRHGAKSITQLELLAKPPAKRDKNNPWPQWPMILRTSSSHEEGCERHWSILTKEFISDGKGHVKGLKVSDIKWTVNKNTGRAEFKEVPGTERTLPCDLALLSIGFIHPEHDNVINQLEVNIDDRGNVVDSDYQTNQEKVFTAGDMRRGQSLVVWAIAEGREAARSADRYLMGEKSLLEARDESLWELA
ncbi:MAG: glutamate synthase subunit beta [Cyclobacteriaceae bacterium]|jgi:glutamate synthase (NADPH/NADH) small chain